MKKLELFILIGMLVFCSIFIGKTTMDYTITPRNLVWCGGTIVLFLLIMLRAIEGQIDLSFLNRRIFMVFGAFIIVSAFTLTKATNRGESWYGIARLILMLIFLFCVTVKIIDTNPNILIKAIILLAFGLTCYGIYQFFTIAENVTKRIGTMANMNLCSSSHLLLMPFSVYAIIRYSKLWKILGVVTVATALFIILFSLKTRSVWVALFVVGTVATLHNRKIAVFTVLAFIVLGAAVYGIKGDVIFNTASIKQRGDLWSQSLNMLKDNPLGIGVDNWRVQIPLYSRNMSDTTRAVAFKKIYFQRPHNDWVWVLTEQGIIGFVLYLAFFILALYYAIKTRSVWLYSAIAGYMTFAFFSFPKERPHHTIFILVIMAFAIAKYHKPLQMKFNPKLVYLGSVLALVGLSFVMVNFIIRFQTERNVFRALHARKAQNWNKVREHTENISRFSTLDSYGTPLLYYQGISNFIQKDYGCALRDFQKANLENPNHIYVLMNLASCYAVHRKIPQAKECYEKVIELYPDYPQAKTCLNAINQKLKGK